MLPQMMPISWFMCFFLLYFCLFCFVFNFFYVSFSSSKNFVFFKFNKFKVMF